MTTLRCQKCKNTAREDQVIHKASTGQDLCPMCGKVIREPHEPERIYDVIIEARRNGKPVSQIAEMTAKEMHKLRKRYPYITITKLVRS